MPVLRTHEPCVPTCINIFYSATWCPYEDTMLFVTPYTEAQAEVCGVYIATIYHLKP